MIPRPKASHYGLTTLTALVIANMIGAGVFTTSGFSLADLHTPHRVLLAWLVAGGMALCGAITYGALSRALHDSGGEYLYLSRLVHPAVGFLAGWVSLLGGFTGAIALAALTLEAYLLPAHGWLAAAVIILCAILHSSGNEPGAWLQNGLVGAKLLLLGTLIAMALTQGHWHHQSSAYPSPPLALGSFAESLMWISLSYAGFNAAIYVAGEARAHLLVPRAMILGTLLTTVFYLGLNAVFLFAAPYEALVGQERIAIIAVDALGLPHLATLLRVIIPLALFTSVSAMILAGPRVYAQMAHDGRLPAWLRFSPESTVPTLSIWFQAALALAFVSIASIRDLLTYLGLTLSVSSAAAAASLFLLRRRGLAQRNIPTQIAAAIYILMTIITASFGAWLNPWQGIAGILTLISGYAIYRFTSKPTNAPNSPA